MPMTTRAAIQTASGQPLIIDELDLPDPRPDQAVLKLFASGICHSQVHELHDGRARPTAFGHEATGVVLRAGSEVTRVREGDRAIVTWVRHQPLPMGRDDRACGATYRGSPIPWPHFTWSEHTLVSEQYLVPIAAAEPADLCSIIGCAVLTGAGAVIHTTRVQPGDSVAVFGAGGVGLSAVRAAAIRGADPIIAVDLRADKLELAREFGATHAVNASDVDPVEAVVDLSGVGVDYAFDAIGVRPTTETINEVTRPGSMGAGNEGGTAVLIGVPGDEMTLNPRAMLSAHRRYVTSFGASNPDRDFPIFLRWHRDGLFPLDRLVTDRFRLEQINEACAALKAGKVMGRAILEYE